MLSWLVGAGGAIASLVLWLWHNYRTNKLLKEKRDLELLVKLQNLNNKGLKAAKEYAAGELRKRNEELAKSDPAAASDAFFGVRKD
jgi:hypothetical protein